MNKHWIKGNNKTPNQLQASWCSFNATRLRESATKSECALMQKLTDAGFLHYRFQQIFRSENIVCFADFYLRKPIKLVIEVDGGYHFNKSQMELDRKKDAYYMSNPIVESVLRITDQQAFDISVEELHDFITSIKKGTINIMYDM